MRDQITGKQEGLLESQGPNPATPCYLWVTDVETCAQKQRDFSPLYFQAQVASGSADVNCLWKHEPTGVQNTEAMVERPLPQHMGLVPLAFRILPAPTICQSSCQVRETWMRDMSLPQWLLRKFQVTQGLLGMWTCLTLGKMAGAGTQAEYAS